MIMIDNYTSEQIIKAAKCCLCKIKCDNCPLVVDVRCSDVFAEYILKNEPAPTDTDTSSTDKYLQRNNNTKTMDCQADGKKKDG